jgi:hypothetical protein
MARPSVQDSQLSLGSAKSAQVFSESPVACENPLRGLHGALGKRIDFFSEQLYI